MERWNCIVPDLDRSTFPERRNGNPRPSGRGTITVVHFIGRLVPGGVERRTLELIEASSSTEFRHIVCVTSGSRGSLDPEYKNAGAEIEYLDIRSLGFPLRLIRLFKRRNADVAHSYLANASGYILLLAFIAGVPNRITNFVSDSDLRRPGRISWVQHIIMRIWINCFSTQIVGLTPMNLEMIWSPRWRLDPRCKVAPTGVMEFTAPRQIPGDLENLSQDTLIAHVGRADLPTKNREKAIRVFATYYKDNPDSRLIFVGRDGGDVAGAAVNRSAWDALAEQLGVSARIHFLGEKSRVVDYLAHSDRFIFTSTLEGLPGIVLEALSAGLPVTSSRLPGTEFISQHASGVVLLDPSESDKVWAKALQDLGSGKLDPDIRDRNIECFKNSGFTLTAAAERYESLWWNHLGGKHEQVLGQRP